MIMREEQMANKETSRSEKSQANVKKRKQTIAKEIKRIKKIKINRNIKKY